MRTYDFAPLGRHSVGFDHLFDLINQSASNESNDNFPPYNIVKTGQDNFRISLAVAGFAPEDLSITAEQSVLTVAGRRRTDGGEQPDYLFRGIANRNFEQRYTLGDYVEVDNATIDNGLLHIDLVRRVPEAMKPRKIEIGSAAASPRITAAGRQAA